jgi:hypothetical protein
VEPYLEQAIKSLSSSRPGTFFFVLGMIGNQPCPLPDAQKLRCWCPASNYQTASPPYGDRPWELYGYLCITSGLGLTEPQVVHLSYVTALNPGFNWKKLLTDSAPRTDLAMGLEAKMGMRGKRAPQQSNPGIKDVQGERVYDAPRIGNGERDVH